MRAIRYARYGGPEVLELREVPKPVPGDDEVLIRVRAAEVTKSDCEMRSFHFSVRWFWLPLRLALGVRRPRRGVLGGYFAGEIVGLGKQVRGFAPGDEVFGTTGLRMGAHAEYLTLPARSTLVAKPRNMSFAEAAAVPLGGLNALHFLRLAEIRQGEAVLVHGAGGSIGAHGVQIAKAMGAEVTAVDAPHKESFVRGLGADAFIDYTQGDFLPDEPRWDVVFDMVPGSDYAGLLRALRPGGRYLVGNARLSVLLRAPFTSRFSDKRVRVALARETREELGALRDMIERGELRSIVDRVHPLEEAAAAHRRVETEARTGAVVIEICPGAA